MRNLCVCAALVVCSIDCGAKPGDEGGETAASDGSTAASSTADGTSTASGTSSSGETSTSATDGPTSTTGTTAGSEECDELLDWELFAPVDVTLRNEGAEPVFLVRAQNCSPREPLAVAGPDGAGEFQWALGDCDVTCNGALVGSCACRAFCAEDSVLMLAPGGAYTITWEGGVFSPHVAPAACIEDPACAHCLLVRVAPKGTYVLRSTGGSEVTGCAVPDDCTCTPNDQGWCEIAASEVSGETREASAMMVYPDEFKAELVFE